MYVWAYVLCQCIAESVSLKRHSEGRQDPSDKMDKRNIHWTHVSVCVISLCMCAHIICHINRFQCTSTGRFFLFLICSSKVWVEENWDLKNKSFSVMTYFPPSNLAWKAVGRVARPLIKLASQRGSVAGKEVHFSVRLVSLIRSLTLKIRAEQKAGGGELIGLLYYQLCGG